MVPVVIEELGVAIKKLIGDCPEIFANNELLYKFTSMRQRTVPMDYDRSIIHTVASALIQGDNVNKDLFRIRGSVCDYSRYASVSYCYKQIYL